MNNDTHPTYGDLFRNRAGRWYVRGSDLELATVRSWIALGIGPAPFEEQHHAAASIDDIDAIRKLREAAGAGKVTPLLPQPETERRETLAQWIRRKRSPKEYKPLPRVTVPLKRPPHPLYGKLAVQVDLPNRVVGEWCVRGSTTFVVAVEQAMVEGRPISEFAMPHVEEAAAEIARLFVEDRKRRGKPTPHPAFTTLGYDEVYRN
ncbi:hypothetical protein [Aureimonas psammosilenae]|uniref:hypothetical protein n=1 Tax=Aureimonas psammosilenae TaxID=2495496 RepID=UPI001260A431|nr:hypothetical protein [Aureimonas psammosilenae]